MEEKLSKRKLLFKLFFSTFYLSAFTFGGGYVIVTLMKKKFADEYKWIDEQEMLDLVAIAQSGPGPIAVNASIVIGYKMAGIPGIICSTLGTVLPPFLIISVVSLFYEVFKSNVFVRYMMDGMLAGVGAVISSVVYDMAAGIVKNKDAISILIMIISFLIAYFAKINVVYIILFCGVLGAVRTVISTRRNSKL